MLTLPNKRNFADVIKLKSWSWGENPGLSRWAQWNHNYPYNKDIEKVRFRGAGIAVIKAETGVMYFEDGGGGHKPRNAGSY